MRPRISLFAVVLLLLPSIAQAQLFPRLFPALRPNAVSSSCPGGVCPTMTTANTNPGHWSYPGTITNHLEQSHGVATAGLSRQEQLNLHDSLHEGTARYPSVSSSGGGSTGSFSGGSIGSRVVQAAPTASVQRIGDRAKFKRNLLAAAKQAVADEKITQDQYEALALAIKFPGVAQKLEAALQETAQENGLVTDQAIDWDKLAAFIERMIPIILKLIDLFSWNSPTYHSIYDYQLVA